MKYDIYEENIKKKLIFFLDLWQTFGSVYILDKSTQDQLKGEK